MSYLLDTCLVSELVKPKPSQRVTGWLEEQDERSLYLSVVTLGELTKGVGKLGPSKRRRQLEDWLKNDLHQRFLGRWIDVDPEISVTWGKILAHAESVGQPMPAVDALIAATAVNRSLTLVTRNTDDFGHSGASLFNPW